MATAEIIRRDGKMRRMMAYQLRMQGKTLKKVGEVFGVSPERARQMITRAIRECSAGPSYQYKNAGVRSDEVEMLMPLVDFLKELSRVITSEAKVLTKENT